MKRSKKLIFCIVILLYVSNVNSQITLGLKGGVNANNVIQDFKNNREEFDTKIRLGFHFGGVLDYKVNNNFRFQTGLTLSNKGFSFDIEEQDVNGLNVKGKAYSSYNYLQIPLHFVYKFKFGLQLHAGPYLAFGTGGKDRIDIITDSIGKFAQENRLKPVIGKVTSRDLNDDEVAFNGFAYGFDFAVGYSKGFSTISLVYSEGLSNVLPNSGNSNPEDKIRNRTISISLTYLIPNRK